MFARFDENPAMTLRVIKETKRYGRTDGRTDGQTHGRTDGRTHGQRENSIPPTNKVCGGYNKKINSFRDTIRVPNGLDPDHWPSSGSKLFAKVISRQQKSPLARKELSNINP